MARENSVSETMRLLKEYERIMRFGEDTKDIILMLGNTGSGKTTMTKFFTRPQDLEAFDTGFEILLRDRANHSISENTTIVSQTIFPDLRIDESVRKAFYDLPGFCDTRNSNIELANSYFVRDVTRHAERVKLLFVVNFNSLRAGQYRSDFLNLLKQVTDLIYRPSQFVDAITLVATKVETNSNRVKPQIVHFLQNVAKDLTEVIEDGGKRMKIKTILDALLRQNAQGEFPRISFFLQPSAPGIVTDFPEVMGQLEEMRNVVHNNSSYVSVCPDDFGISVSPEAKLYVRGVVEAVYAQLTACMLEMGQKLMETMDQQLRAAAPKEIGIHFEQLESTRAAVTSLNTSRNRHQFYEILQKNFAKTLGSELEKVEKQEKILSFLEEVGETVFSVFPLKDWIFPIQEAVKSQEQAVSELAKKLSDQTALDISAFFSRAKREMPTEVQDPGARKKTVDKCKLFADVLEQTKSRLEREDSYNDFIRSINSINSTLGLGHSLEALPKDVKLEKLLPDVKVLKSMWMTPLQDTLVHVEKVKTMEHFQGQLDEKDQQAQKMEKRLDQNERENLELTQKLRDEGRKLEKLETALERGEREAREMKERLDKKEEESKELKEKVKEIENKKSSIDPLTLLAPLATVLTAAKEIAKFYKESDPFPDVRPPHEPSYPSSSGPFPDIRTIPHGPAPSSPFTEIRDAPDIRRPRPITPPSPPSPLQSTPTAPKVPLPNPGCSTPHFTEITRPKPTIPVPSISAPTRPVSSVPNPYRPISTFPIPPVSIPSNPNPIGRPDPTVSSVIGGPSSPFNLLTDPLSILGQNVFSLGKK